MPTYLVEFFLPNRTADEVNRLALAERSVQVIAVPEDETVFWLAQAESLDALNLLLAQRGVMPERIVEAAEQHRKGEEMIDHVTVNVEDVPAAKEFYRQALAPLGLTLKMEFESAAGFGSGDGVPPFWLGSRPERGASHVAFSAPDRAAVDAFYEAALAAGGSDNGTPGLRPHLHPNYYAAFVHDASGNNIEAVCHLPE